MRRKFRNQTWLLTRVAVLSQHPFNTSFTLIYTIIAVERSRVGKIYPFSVVDGSIFHPFLVTFDPSVTD